jgi:sulfite reductase alpha subunit-like flavoprotein
MTYSDTFCNAGNLYNDLLTKLGAKRIGDILRHDASSGELPEDMAAEWTADWLSLFNDAETESSNPMETAGDQI